jgi:hypothetical protein
MENVQNKIVLLHWIGKFGNRMFQYAFGCSYAKKYNCIFYVPSKWEGDIIFRENKYCKIITDDILLHHINQCLYINDYDKVQYYKEQLSQYKIRTNDTIEFVSFENKQNLGKINVAFGDLHCMYFSHCFDFMDTDLIKEIFTFNDAVLNSEMYKWFFTNKYKYDVVHLRRGDINMLNYNGAHSVISKQSYLNQIEKLGLCKENIIWVSDDNKEQTLNKWHAKSHGHRWTFPCGEHFCEEIFLDFLPDFLMIIFAKTILRGNSSFSWWSSYLSNATIYSPIMKPKPDNMKNKHYIMDTEFVEGNHPHFMGSKCEGQFNDIIFHNSLKPY